MSDLFDKLPDLPSTAAPNFLQRVREVLQALKNGTNGDQLITVSDLVKSGVALPTAPNAGGNGNGSGSPIQPIPTPAFPVYVPDLSPPPAPTGITAVGGFSAIYISTDDPAFTVGHGYDRTIVYGTKYGGTGPLPTYTEGVTPIINEFVGAFGAHPSDPGTTWHIWLKWKSVDGVLSTIAGGTNGVSATTAQDISMLLDVLTGQITESQLYADLGARIDMIDAPYTVTGSVAQRIKTETDARATSIAQEVSDRQAAITSEATTRAAAITQEANDRAAAVAAEASARGTAITNERTLWQAGDTSLAQQISLLTAGTAGGFDYGKVWYYDSTVESWTAANATATQNAGWVDLAATAADPQFLSPTGLAVNGTTYPVVKMRVKRLAGSTWDGSIFFATSGGHGISASYYKQIANPSLAIGDTTVLEWDMSSLTAGGTNWITSTISQIRVDLGSSSTDSFSIDWIAIGRNAPGASVAGLMVEQQARVDGDSAEAALRVTLTARVDGHDTSIAANTAAINSEATTRANADSATSSQITALTATVNTNTAAIATEQTARANGDSALTTQLNSLTTTVNNNSSAITSESTTRANADSSLSSQINSVSATANAKNKTYRQATAPTSGLVTGDVWFDTSNSNKSYRWDGASWIATDDTRIAANAAAITTEQSTRANADSALSTQINSVSAVANGKNKTYRQSTAPTSGMTAGDVWYNTSNNNLAYRYDGAAWVLTEDPRIGLNAAAIVTEQQARADGDTANATSINTLTTTVSGHTTSIQTAQTSINGLLAQYTVKIDNNGYVAGFGLASTLNNATPYSRFLIRADQFAIASPSGPGITPITPFIVNTTPVVENGVSIPVGVYMDAAYVRNLSAMIARFGTASIDDAKIGSLSAAKLTAGSMAVGAYIQSTGYVAGSTGWRINGNGTAEFSGLTVRGGVYATFGTIGGATIIGNAIYSSDWNGTLGPTGAGWYIASNSNAYFNQISMRGDIFGGSFTGYAWPAPGQTGYYLGAPGLLLGNANNGKFFQVTSGGDLYAPNFSIVNGVATFSGSLSAASGTFSGELSAARIGVGSYGNPVTFFDAIYPTLPLRSVASSTFMYSGGTAASRDVASTCFDGDGNPYACTITEYYGPPVTGEDATFRVGDGGVPINRRIRTGTVRFHVTAAAQVDHYFTLWVRINNANGYVGAWMALAILVEPQASYGTASLTSAVEFGLGSGDIVQFGMSASDTSQNFQDFSKNNINYGALTVLAFNF